MSDAIRLCPPKAEQVRVYYYGGAPRPANPAYLALLGLVLIVGAASTLAWYFGEFSLDERASSGEPQAQYLLGKRVFENATRPRDYERAAALIRQAAGQGYPKAQTALGLLCEKGIGVPKSYPEALKWFRRAADQGYSVAQNELGVMYAKGHGVSRDLGEAARWCRLAATKGSEIAKRNLQLAEVANLKPIPTLRTTAKQVYRQTVVQKVEADGVTVTFIPQGGGIGMAKLKVESLPSNLQQLCKFATKEGTAPDSAYSQIGAVATTL